MCPKYHCMLNIWSIRLNSEMILDRSFVWKNKPYPLLINHPYKLRARDKVWSKLHSFSHRKSDSCAKTHGQIKTKLTLLATQPLLQARQRKQLLHRLEVRVERRNVPVVDYSFVEQKQSSHAVPCWSLWEWWHVKAVLVLNTGQPVSDANSI